jgi:hypothetical protein
VAANTLVLMLHEMGHVHIADGARSLRTIAAWLNERGIRTARDRRVDARNGRAIAGAVARLMPWPHERRALVSSGPTSQRPLSDAHRDDWKTVTKGRNHEG